jgi:glutaredoxin-like YruB-family protein
MNVKIYTTPTCGYCHQAKSYFNELGIKYEEHDVSRDQQAAEEMVKLTGQMGVPVIIINGQAVIGFNRERIKQLLEAADQHPHLGVKVADAPGKGALVGAVSPASPGEIAGLKQGDIITRINDTQILGAADLEKAIASLNGRTRVVVAFLRGGQTLGSEFVI